MHGVTSSTMKGRRGGVGRAGWWRRLARAATGGSVTVCMVASATSAVAAPVTTVLPPGAYYDAGLRVSFDLKPDGDLFLLDDLNDCQKKGSLWASLGTPDGAGFTGTYYGYYDDDPTEPCAKGSSVITFAPTSDGTGITYRVDGSAGTLVSAVDTVQKLVGKWQISGVGATWLRGRVANFDFALRFNPFARDPLTGTYLAEALAVEFDLEIFREAVPKPDSTRLAFAVAEYSPTSRILTVTLDLDSVLDSDDDKNYTLELSFVVDSPSGTTDAGSWRLSTWLRGPTGTASVPLGSGFASARRLR